MNIIIDGRALQGNITGIGKFLLSALHSFSLMNVTCIILHNKNIRPEIKQELEALGHETYKDKHILCFNSLLWFVFRLPFIFRKFNFDYIWFPNNFGTYIFGKYNVLLTVHDAVYFDFPETMNVAEKLLSKIFLKKSIRRANIIWFVSEFTSSRYSELFNIAHAKVVVGSDIDRTLFCPINTKNSSRSVLSKYDIYGEYVLFVGTCEPRKNLQFLVSMSKDIEMLGLSIVVVGAKGWGDENEFTNIIYPGYVLDEDLPALFKFAEIYISPSLYEGFGLPLIEAQSMGTPVICAKNSAQYEVISGSGIAVSGWVISEWISSIEHVIENRSQYSTLSLENSKKFSMDSVVDSVIKELKNQSENKFNLGCTN